MVTYFATTRAALSEGTFYYTVQRRDGEIVRCAAYTRGRYAGIFDQVPRGMNRFNQEEYVQSQRQYAAARQQLKAGAVS